MATLGWLMPSDASAIRSARSRVTLAPAESGLAREPVRGCAGTWRYRGGPTEGSPLSARTHQTKSDGPGLFRHRNRAARRVEATRAWFQGGMAAWPGRAQANARSPRAPERSHLCFGRATRAPVTPAQCLLSHRRPGVWSGHVRSGACRGRTLTRRSRGLLSAPVQDVRGRLLPPRQGKPQPLLGPLSRLEAWPSPGRSRRRETTHRRDDAGRWRAVAEERRRHGAR